MYDVGVILGSGISGHGVSENSEDERQLTRTKQRRRVTFVPFPHKTLVSGEDAVCRWSTKSISNTNDSNITEEYDLIQLAAYHDGICMPDKLINRSSSSSLHIFSTAEAIECLSSAKQGRNISVSISGDSYTRQLFLGLGDILLGNSSNHKLTTQQLRIGLLAKYNEVLASRHREDPSFPNVQYTCFGECYGGYTSGDENFSVRCSRCINYFTQFSDSAVGVVGAGVHNLRRAGHIVAKRMKIARDLLPKPKHAKEVATGETSLSVNETIKDFEQFFDLADKTIYVSMPSYQTEKVPIPFRNSTHHTHAGRIYYGLLPSLAPQMKHHPFIDVFQLTKACYWSNCSTDGGHR